MGCEELLSIVDEINTRAQLTGNKMTTTIGLIHIYHPQLLSLRPFELLICALVICYALSGKYTNHNKDICLRILWAHTPYVLSEHALTSSEQSPAGAGIWKR